MENVESLCSEIKNSHIEYSNNAKKIEKLNTALYFAAKTISLLGTNIYSFALSLYILKITGSGTSFALNVLIAMLPRIILGPFAGILADRVNRKKLTVAFDIISGLMVFLLLGLSSIYGLKIIFIYITGFVLSTINTFYDTALTSSLPNLVSGKKLMKINSYTSISMSISGILSPVLAGVMYGLIPIKIFLFINASSFIVSAILEMFINFNFNKDEADSLKEKINLNILKKEFEEIKEFVDGQKVMRVLLKYALMINFFFTASISVVYPYIINKVLKMSSSEYGAFQGSYFLGMIVCSVIIANRKEKKISGKRIALGLMSLGVILAFIGAPTIGFGIFRMKVMLIGYNLVLIFALGAILISINTPMLVAMQKLTPENLRGRITGVLGTLTAGIAPLGIILAGLIIDKVHPFIILLISGICIVLASANMLRNKDIDLDLD